jgi:hypothetical protein
MAQQIAKRDARKCMKIRGGLDAMEARGKWALLDKQVRAFC